jgi:AcrR family transcriptional regulator
VPRAGLSTDAVVEEAARLVDEAGSAQLSLARLAKRFGVAQPSLYKHVEGMEALRRLLALRVMGELADALRRAATGRSGEEALRGIAGAYRGYALAHPGRYGVLLGVRTGDDPQLAAAAEEILQVLYDVLGGYGISDRGDAVDAARFVRSTLHGFVALELGGGFEMPYPLDRSYERLVSATGAALARW